MSTALFRSQPKYQGFVSDGYFQTPDGRVHYRPAPDVDATRGRLAGLLGDLPADPPAGPLVRLVPIDGRLPGLRQAAVIEAEAFKAPPRVLTAFRSRGGVVDVVAGNASLHPAYEGVNRGRQVNGFCAWGAKPPLIVVSADGAPDDVLHEFGHYVDRGYRFSDSDTWKWLVSAALSSFVGEYGEIVSGPLIGFNAYRSPCEGFAEAFRLFCGPARDRLSKRMRAFIEMACRE